MFLHFAFVKFAIQLSLKLLMNQRGICTDLSYGLVVKILKSP